MACSLPKKERTESSSSHRLLPFITDRSDHRPPLTSSSLLGEGRRAKEVPCRGGPGVPPTATVFHASRKQERSDPVGGTQPPLKNLLGFLLLTLEHEHSPIKKFFKVF